MRRIVLLLIAVVALAYATAIALPAQSAAAPTSVAPTQHNAHIHHHPEAAKLKNPVAATPEAIAEGKALYTKRCVRCHGESGKGDGPERGDREVADLTDAEWKHGNTDGELFVLIRDGSTKAGMPKFGQALTARQIWNVINYVRTLRDQGSAIRDQGFEISSHR